MAPPIRAFASALLGSVLFFFPGASIVRAETLVPVPKLADPPVNKTVGPTSVSAPPTLPGGATATTETFGSWQVSCVIQGGVKRCVFNQQQANQQTGLRLLIELAPVDGKVEGIGILPFGLALDAGVVFQVDDQPAAAPARFKTCLSLGCVLPINFIGQQVSALRAGTTLKAKVTLETGQNVTLAIPLDGLSAALDRTIALKR